MKLVIFPARLLACFLQPAPASRPPTLSSSSRSRKPSFASTCRRSRSPRSTFPASNSISARPCPDTVELHAVEVPDVKYRYVVVGGRTVLVDPDTRKVVHIINRRYGWCGAAFGRPAPASPTPRPCSIVSRKGRRSKAMRSGRNTELHDVDVSGGGTVITGIVIGGIGAPRRVLHICRTDPPRTAIGRRQRSNSLCLKSMRRQSKMPAIAVGNQSETADPFGGPRSAVCEAQQSQSGRGTRVRRLVGLHS